MLRVKNQNIFKDNEDPIEHFIKTSQKISSGLSAEELKEFEEKERIKDYRAKM